MGGIKNGGNIEFLKLPRSGFFHLAIIQTFVIIHICYDYPIESGAFQPDVNKSNNP
jgi:hypothetical protein